MASIKRRNFLKQSILATSGIILAPNFISCNGEEITEEIKNNLKAINFKEGVASFDPTNSQVIIWTRYTSSRTSIEIHWQIASDKDFKKIIRENKVTTSAERDYTVAIEVKDLKENQKLYYRFINLKDNAVSPIGETLTFGSDTSEIKMAVTSCANYANGYFNVYEAIKNSDTDVVVHLGDYIYEYGKNTYGSFRTPKPEGEIVNLDQYRERYRQYRSDKQLMELHQKKPFICVWDDHEITNDSYKDGAENHQENEGSYNDRKKVALRAYSEYLPNTTNLTDNNIIYRNLKLGSLVDLIMLDTRIIGRDKQLSYSNYLSATGEFNASTFQKDLFNKNRTMLGETQRNWLLQQMNSTSSTWQIIGQQVLMGKMLLPVELLTLFSKIQEEVKKLGSAKLETYKAFQSAVIELVTLKTRLLQGDTSLTEAEKVRIKTVVPYNLDAWDGYFMEREVILNSFKGKKVVVLAGDTHNAWQNDLTVANGTKVATELATSSVSSPGLEVYLGASSSQFEKALEILIDNLNYLNASDRGFMKLTINSSTINTNWDFVDTITTKVFSVTTKKSFSI